MGKTIDQLQLRDEALPEPAPRPLPDNVRWERFLQRIEDLRGTGDAGWADDTLSGIYDTVRKTGRITDGQERAITNIEAAIARKQASPGYRRPTRKWDRPADVPRCRRCRRQLTDQESIARGIGPECVLKEGGDA